jgi:hypothetical protein
LYGIPLRLDNVQILIPDPGDENFLWDETMMSPEGAPPRLQRHSPVPDPPGGTYPQAPPFRLTGRTRSYTRGYAYVSDWAIADRDRDFERLVRTRMPPNVFPSTGADGNLNIEPIPGMVKLIPGVPFVYHLDGDPQQSVTVACLQMAHSLSAYPGIAREVQELTKGLLRVTFGEVSDGEVTQKPIYQFPGLKRNQRSAPAKEGSNDGSFNLAATVGQGEGQGCYMPAVQSSDPEFQHAVQQVTRTLHRFYRLIVPRCISKFEWDVLEFHSKVNNVFGFGGFEPNNTGLQMNVSSGFTSLANLIGEHQGSFHTDEHDHVPRWTLCTLCFRLPSGT